MAKPTSGLAWENHIMGKQEFSLDHLHPHFWEITIPSTGKHPARSLQLAVSYSLHCFTRRLKDGETVSGDAWYSDNRESRVFDVMRWELSKYLPDIIATLVLRKFGRIVGGMAGIAGLKTVRSDEQILDTHINADLFVSDRQQRRLKLTQARHKVASCWVFGNGDGRGFRGKLSAPTNVQRHITLRQFQFAVFKGKSAVSEFSRLAVSLGFKGGVFCPPFKEVLERGLLVSQALLQRNTGNVVQKGKLGQFLDFGQSGVCATIPHLFLSLRVGIRAVAKDAVIDKSHTPEGLSQQRFLLRVRVEPELIGAFNFHVLHDEVDVGEAQPQKLANL